MPRTDWAADQHLSAVSAFLNMSAYTQGLAIPGNPWFRLTGCSAWNLPWSFDDNTAPGIELPPQPDWSVWTGPGQSVADILNAQELSYQWAMTQGETDYVGYAYRPAWTGAPSTNVLWCIVAQWMLPFVSGSGLITDASKRRNLPPVWPGLDNVTLGEAVALDVALTIAGPMDGVIVELSSVGEDRDFYSFNGQLSYPHLAALAFADDNGAIECYQPISFAKHILTPSRLWRAETCYIRCDPFVSGTVTPWVCTLPTNP